MSSHTLYDRLGGAHAIATVVDHFSEQTAANDAVSQNPALREANERVPIAGLKFLRTLFFCEATGGPFTYTGRALADAHSELAITGGEFDEVQAELQRSLDHFDVPQDLQTELLELFASQKPVVVQG